MASWVKSYGSQLSCMSMLIFFPQLSFNHCGLFMGRERCLIFEMPVNWRCTLRIQYWKGASDSQNIGFLKDKLKQIEINKNNIQRKAPTKTNVQILVSFSLLHIFNL